MVDTVRAYNKTDLDGSTKRKTKQVKVKPNVPERRGRRYAKTGIMAARDAPSNKRDGVRLTRQVATSSNVLVGGARQDRRRGGPLRFSTFTSVSVLSKSGDVKRLEFCHRQRVVNVYSLLSASEQQPRKLKTASVTAASAARKRTQFAQSVPVSRRLRSFQRG